MPTEVTLIIPWRRLDCTCRSWRHKWRRCRKRTSWKRRIFPRSRGPEQERQKDGATETDGVNDVSFYVVEIRMQLVSEDNPVENYAIQASDIATDPILWTVSSNSIW